jgi:predicted O-linked N-acetylglucosamine transferase (SPINDLY family)
MGVPVVTLDGTRFLGRMSGSFLRHIGADDLVARDRSAYAALAVDLARDTDRRARLRRELRGRLLASPLCDAESHARSLVVGYRALWRDWCNAARRPRGAA